MEISVLPLDEDEWRDNRYFAEWSQYFLTPSKVTAASICDVGRVDNIYLSHLYSFKSGRHRYLIFDDEQNLNTSSVQDSLKAIRAIKGLRGHLCEAQDKTDGTYGVSPGHDPFHDGYTYLWYCGEEKGG